MMATRKHLVSRKSQIVPIKKGGATHDPECVSLAIEEFKRAAGNPNVGSLKLELDKRTGVIKLDARSTDKQVVTKEILGPGLDIVTHYDGRSLKRNERDANILTLLDRGLTQVQVATKLGVSQALVSRVKNSG